MSDSKQNENKKKNKGLENLSKPGQTNNPNGRPKGQKNYRTLYREALLNLAKLNDTEPDAIELKIIMSGLKRATKGDYRFYKDTLDRLLGMPTQKQQISGPNDESLKIEHSGGILVDKNLGTIKQEYEKQLEVALKNNE